MFDATTALVQLQQYLWAVAAVLLLLASTHDVATRTIPDFVPLGLLAVGIIGRLVDHDIIAALIASISLFFLSALCWRFGWLGGGDAKLLTACAWLTPPLLVPRLVFLTAIAGGILACLYLALGRLAPIFRKPRANTRPRSLLGRIARVERWRIGHRASLPYGCAIAAATLLTLYGR